MDHSQRKMHAVASALALSLPLFGGCAPVDGGAAASGAGAEAADGGLDDLSDKAGASLRYEAEDRSSQSGCSERTTHRGYTGSGFMDYGGNGTWIEWSGVRVSSAGRYELSFRYANGSGGNRRAALVVNGSDVGNLSFSRTGAWTAWMTESSEVTLRAGTNTVRVRANSGSGGPNLDHLVVRATDLCPDDPNKAEPGECGCGTPEGSCSTGSASAECGLADEGSTVSIGCEDGATITSIDFASYGTPAGSCSDGFALSSCHAASSFQIVEDACIGKQSCQVQASNRVFGDPCGGTRKRLAVGYSCSNSSDSGSVDVVSRCASVVIDELCRKNAPCALCQGDCDADRGCEGDLVCYRPNGETDADFCVDPNWLSDTGDGSDDGSGDDGGSGNPAGGPIDVLGTTTAKSQSGDLRVRVPSQASRGDLLLLFVHRTDGPNLWSMSDFANRAAPSSGWRKSPVQCAIDNAARVQDFDCRGERNDLNQVLFYKEAASGDADSTVRINMPGSKPAWAIMTAVRGASTTSPVRAWVGQTEPDRRAQSRFPSVPGAQSGDLLLLSQSFDDGGSVGTAKWLVNEQSFLAPQGFTRLAVVIDNDEAGHLFGKVLSTSGPTGEHMTQGSGTAGHNKDANVSIVIRAAGSN